MEDQHRQPRPVPQDLLAVRLNLIATSHAQDEFFIASVTKTVTTAAIMRLVEQGKMDLNAPLAPYLGDLTVETMAPGDPPEFRRSRVARMPHIAHAIAAGQRRQCAVGGHA